MCVHPEMNSSGRKIFFCGMREDREKGRHFSADCRLRKGEEKYGAAFQPARNYRIGCYNYSSGSAFAEVIIVNAFNEYVRERFSAVGDIDIKSMMGGYLVYFNGKLIGDIGGNELFLKRTPTSDRLLADAELRYPYEGSKTMMHVFDRFEDTAFIAELLECMYAELPEKKHQKN